MNVVNSKMGSVVIIVGLSCFIILIMNFYMNCVFVYFDVVYFWICFIKFGFYLGIDSVVIWLSRVWYCLLVIVLRWFVCSRFVDSNC